MFGSGGWHSSGNIVVERNGSGVELQTLDYENLGSNPVLRR